MPRKRRAPTPEEPVPLRRSARIKRKREEQLERERERVQQEASAVREDKPSSQPSRKRQKRAPAASKPVRKAKQKKTKAKPAVKAKAAVKEKASASKQQGADTDGMPKTLADHSGDAAGKTKASASQHKDTVTDGMSNTLIDDPGEGSNSAAQPTSLELTDSFVKSLLPGAMFGLADDIFGRGFWDVAREHALRYEQFTTSQDFARFCEAQQQLYLQPDAQNEDAELRLWDVLQHRFRCGLDDLFRYGLRPSLGKKDTCGAGGTFAQYCTKLAAILAHPLWSASSHLAHVRWLLQRVIQERVSGHIRPLVPPYSYHRPPFVSTARHWGFETSMRMSLAASVSGGGGNSSGTDSIVDLAQATRDASHAAMRAEAELAQFLFDAAAPRDFYWLDQQLVPLHEPGSKDADQSSDEDGENDENDENDENEQDIDSGESSPNPYGLEVDESIRRGNFEMDEYKHFEVTKRQDQRRLWDKQTNWKRDWERHEKKTRKGKASVHNVSPGDDQVFFDLRVQDLDRLLSLMSQADFLELDEYATPECYLAGYVRAHEAYGYGPAEAGLPSGNEAGATASAPPNLNCRQCAQKYHQGSRPPKSRPREDDSGNSLYLADDDLGIGHDHSHNIFTPPDHDHFIHEQFVRDVGPSQALEWLIGRKCEWLLSGWRERMIREALEKEQDWDEQGNELSLPDVPPFDPPVQAHLDRTFTHPSQLSILSRTHGQPHASELWCFNELGGEGEAA
ncbi:MAG: hypothetical protein SEPTF4163_000779 [Sporothrix epigloea]